MGLLSLFASANEIAAEEVILSCIGQYDTDEKRKQPTEFKVLVNLAEKEVHFSGFPETLIFVDTSVLGHSIIMRGPAGYSDNKQFFGFIDRLNGELRVTTWGSFSGDLVLKNVWLQANCKKAEKLF